MAGNDVIVGRNADFIFRRIADEGILVPLYKKDNDEPCIYTLNGLASFIWEKLNQPCSIEQLRSAILAEYKADPEILVSDLERFLVEMKTIGAIKETH